jgi:hypothetical protein
VSDARSLELALKSWGSTQLFSAIPTLEGT